MFKVSPEALAHQPPHQLDVALAVTDIDGLKSSAVIDGVNLPDHLGGDAEEITSVDAQPVIFCLRRELSNSSDH